MIYMQFIIIFCLIAIVFGLIRAISTLKELRGFYKDSIQMEGQILNMVNRIEKRVSNLENMGSLKKAKVNNNKELFPGFENMATYAELKRRQEENQ